jgi:hypothetical protein
MSKEWRLLDRLALPLIMLSSSEIFIVDGNEGRLLLEANIWLVSCGG